MGETVDFVAGEREKITLRKNCDVLRKTERFPADRGWMFMLRHKEITDQPESVSSSKCQIYRRQCLWFSLSGDRGLKQTELLVNCDS
jgi:hypothetical protein